MLSGQIGWRVSNWWEGQLQVPVPVPECEAVLLTMCQEILSIRT